MKYLKSVAVILFSMSLIPVSSAHEEVCQLPPKTTAFSFWSSCSDVKIDGCTLEAECRKKDGSERHANFDMNKFPQCYSDFFGGRNMENRDGKLCCGYAGTYQICGD